MNELIPKIGLEIHLELKTKTKLFCSCLNNPEEIEPNKNICPICTGYPGVLPAVNKQAVIYAYSLAKALKMKINEKSYFARKHYFYPDLPKNYQISQYEIPLAENGELFLLRPNLGKKVRIRRIHLEEDTARNLHYPNYSVVDFNRSGIPLIEIVTEPDLRSPEEAEIFAEEFVLLIRYLKISEIKVEKGGIRFEANVSLGKGKELGTKVEIKNLGSIQALKSASECEIKRQKSLIEKGEKIVQETRGFDEIKNITFSQRIKEMAEDYRYFIDPDLPPLVIDEEIKKLAIEKEIPSDKKLRLIKEYKLDIEKVHFLVRQEKIADFFEESFSELYRLINDFEKTKKLILGYLLNDLIGLLTKLKISEDDLEKKIHPHEFAHLLFDFSQNKISSKILKEALRSALEEGVKIEEFLKGKEKITDIAIISQILEEVLQENSKAVQDYLNGKESALEHLVGMVLKKTQGKADSELTRKLLLDKLKNG